MLDSELFFFSSNNCSLFSVRDINNMSFSSLLFYIMFLLHVASYLEINIQ